MKLYIKWACPAFVRVDRRSPLTLKDRNINSQSGIGAAAPPHQQHGVLWLLDLRMNIDYLACAYYIAFCTAQLGLALKSLLQPVGGTTERLLYSQCFCCALILQGLSTAAGCALALQSIHEFHPLDSIPQSFLLQKSHSLNMLIVC